MTSVVVWKPNRISENRNREGEIRKRNRPFVFVRVLVNPLLRGATELRFGNKPYAKLHRADRFPISSSALEEALVRERSRSIRHPFLETGSRFVQAIVEYLLRELISMGCSIFSKNNAVLVLIKELA